MMIEMVEPLARWCTAIVEVLGISIITSVAIYIPFFAVIKLLKREKMANVVQKVRQRLGGGILLGLEFLIAADIIQTVAIELTFRTVGVLAVIVMIRTFLSFTLELELDGKLPWQVEG